jgi:hypothetical protein
MEFDDGKHMDPNTMQHVTVLVANTMPLVPPDPFAFPPNFD